MGTLITNKHGLPDAIVQATMVDKHVVRGDISVTQLIDAPQIRQLKRYNDLEEDAMDRIWALLGTAVHHILERSEISSTEARKLIEAASILIEQGEDKAAEWIKKFVVEKFPDSTNDNVMLETTLTMNFEGMDISGTIDKFNKEEGILEDYKTCSVWAYVYEESKKKWYAQQNLYAFMLRKRGYEVKEARIVAIFRDWSASKKKMSKDYPPHPVMIIPIKLYDEDFMRNYISNRVALHRASEDGNTPDCTGKERWAKGDSFAVKMAGRKKALRVLDKEKFAQAFIDKEQHKYDSKMYIESRPGEDGRCDKYCAVAAVCPQRKKKLELLAKNSEQINE